jgi:hypothetical protein
MTTYNQKETTMSPLAEQLNELQELLFKFPLDYIRLTQDADQQKLINEEQRLVSDHTELLLEFLSCLSQTGIRTHEAILNNSKFKEGDLVKVYSPPVQGYGSIVEVCLQQREPDNYSVGVYYDVVLTRDLCDKPLIDELFYVEEKYISLVKENV